MKTNCSLKSMLWNLYKDDKITYGEWQILQKKLEGHDRELIKSIEAEPVKHGRWINGKCSECACDRVITKVYRGDEVAWIATYRDNYCPNCGTRMDLEEVEV